MEVPAEIRNKAVDTKVGNIMVTQGGILLVAEVDFLLVAEDNFLLVVEVDFLPAAEDNFLPVAEEDFLLTEGFQILELSKAAEDTMHSEAEAEAEAEEDFTETVVVRFKGEMLVEDSQVAAEAEIVVEDLMQM